MNKEPTERDDAEPMNPIIDATLARSGGWMPFDRFMDLALYTPGLGYYANTLAKFGHMPRSGSDFVTGPEMTPLFGGTLAVAVADALEHTGTRDVWEFGAGSGALAAQLLGALGDRLASYTIVDLSGTLRERQQQKLAPWGDKVRWVNALPDAIEGVVVGNEVLDAMPVKLLARVGSQWFERGVTRAPDGKLVHADQPTDLRPPVEIPGDHDYLTEIHLPAEAFIATLAEHLTNGAAFFLDYGFPESEYYHPQRHMGTVMCHRGHQADGNALVNVGLKDITAHVNFSGVALAGQDAGLTVLGYCSQARFLINCGLVSRLEDASLPERTLAARLVHEHEMGELFKVIAFCNGEPWDAVGFVEGDRSHTL